VDEETKVAAVSQSLSFILIGIVVLYAVLQCNVHDRVHDRQKNQTVY